MLVISKFRPSILLRSIKGRLIVKQNMFIFSVLIISSCTFIPTVSDDQSYADNCSMLTRELTLTTEFIDFHRGCGTSAESGACFLAVAIGVPAFSFVVSGSIVLMNNTLNWLEYQGTCKTGYLAQKII
jgi:hypothetical protein